MSLLPPAFAPVGFPGQRGQSNIPLGSAIGPPGTRGISTDALNTSVSIWNSAPSNALVTSGYVVRPWDEKSYHKNVRGGHMLFGYRSSSLKRDDPKTIVNLTDFNEILRNTYHRAVEGRVTESAGAEFDADSVADHMGDAPTMDELFYRGELQWGDPRYEDMMMSERTTESRLKYLTLEGIIRRWNFLGVQKVDVDNTQYRVITAVISGPTELSNVFAQYLSPLAPLKLIIKRYLNKATGEYEHFYVQPWTSPNSVVDKPSMVEMGYEDMSGLWRQGYVIDVGYVRHMGDKPADERKRIQGVNAVGIGGKFANDAMGSLPTMEAVLTNPSRDH